MWRNQRWGKQAALLWLLALVTVPGCTQLPTKKAETKKPLMLPASIAIVTAGSADLLFSQDALLEQAYDRLEARSWQLLTERAEVQVLERRNLQVVRAEQRTQHLYGMDDSSAVGVGKLSGARAVLVYRIWLPSWRDRFLAKEQALPFTLTGKLIEVETGRVLWAHSLTVLSTDCQQRDCWLGGKPQGAVWPILASGVDQLVAALAQVVPCRRTC